MNAMEAAKQDVLSAIELVRAIADAIRELGEVPSGQLYARVMGVMDIRCFERVVTLLVDARLVERLPNNILRWVG
jgi:hypothetical protein